MKLCRSIICVIMGVHAKSHREILSLSHVASVSVLENRSTRAQRFRPKTQNAPRPYRNATKLCRSIICVIMGVHANIHREILSLSHVASVSVLENRRPLDLGKEF